MRASLLVLLALAPLVATAEPPPVSSFTNFAKYESMKISPKGTYLALTRRTAEHEAMTVLRMPDLTLSGQAHFGRLMDVDSFQWANDTRLLIAPTRRFPGSIAYKARTGEIFAIDANGKNAEILFGFAAGKMQTGTRVAQRQAVYAAAEIVDSLPQETNEVLIQTYGYGIEGEQNTAYRMDVRNGKLRKIAGSPLRNGTFVTDADHQVSLVYGQDLKGDFKVFHRPPRAQEWQLMASSERQEGVLWPIGAFGNSGEFLVLDNRDAPTDGAFAWSPQTGAARLLYRHPEADLVPIGTDPSGRPWGFGYIDHFPAYWYPDREHPLAKLHQQLVATYPQHDVRITSQTDDLALAVARVSSPTQPPMFYLVDVKQRRITQHLAAYPDLEPEQLASVDPIEFKARDGLMVRGYLATPRGPTTKGLPLIVLVHGGPHGVYDAYVFDYEVQLLASRGYAVLQVNYRGSGGRGRAFEAAGFGRWGREMQDDITDGVKWAIGDGVADARRICIYGGSYGAYAALTGAFREPEMFRCAVGMAGVYDLPLMFEKGDIQTVERGVNYLKLAVGTDIEELRRRSPVYNAEKIRAAVMLLHGKDDERAPFEHAKRMRAALEKAGRPPEWYTEWGEGHGFFDEANRAAAYERMLAFFDKHLAPAPSGEL